MPRPSNRDGSGVSREALVAITDAKPRHRRRTGADARASWSPTDRIIFEPEREAITGYKPQWYYEKEKKKANVPGASNSARAAWAGYCRNSRRGCASAPPCVMEVPMLSLTWSPTLPGLVLPPGRPSIASSPTKTRLWPIREVAMRNRPPDRRVGSPRCGGAERPGNGTFSFAKSDPKRVHFETQEKIATSLAIDPWLGVRDRTVAVCTRHRMRFGLHVSPVDTRKLAVIYQQRQRELAALSRMHGVRP